MTIGATMRSIRLGQHRSVADVAEALGIHRPNLYQLEDGRWGPSHSMFIRWAKALGVKSPASLLAKCDGHLREVGRPRKILQASS